MEDFIIKLQAALDNAASQKRINSDIKELQKSINMLRLTATLMKGDSKKTINQTIRQMEGQLNQVKLKARIDQRNLKADVNKALNNISFNDIQMNFNRDKTKLKAKKVIADVKKAVQSSPISANIELKTQKLQNQLTTYLSKNSKIKESKNLLNEADKLREKISQVNDKDSLRNATDSFQLFKSEVSATGYQAKSASDRIKGLIGKVTKIGSAFGVASVAISNFQKSLKTIKTNDDILVEISKTSNSTKQQLEELGDTAFQTASKFGQLSSDYLTAVQEMNRSGFYDEAGRALGELSLKAQAAGDISADVAQKYLLATNAAYDYKGSIEKLTAVLDGQNAITNHFSTDMDTMASATTQAGSVAANTGVKIEELSAMVGTISARTKEAGKKTGTGIKSLLVNLQNISSDKIVDTLNKANASMTETVNGVEKLRNPIDILKDLAKTYNALDENDPLKSEITTNIGQKYHANQLSALLSGWSDYEEMLKTYSDGMGSAEIEAQKTADSLSGRLSALQNSWDSLVNSITNKDALKDGISLFDGLINSAERLIDVFDVIPVAMAGVTAFKTAKDKDYGITKVFDWDSGKLSLEGNFMGIDFTQIKHFKEASEAIADWNSELKTGQADINKFGKDIVKNNTQLREYLKTCSVDAPASLEGYKQHLQDAGEATGSLRLGTTLLTTAISFGAGILINLGIKGLQYLINYEQKQKEAFENAKTATEEAAKSIRDLKSEMSDTSSKAKELSSEFAKLVQGVNPLTNENEKLSTEQYERFLDVNNQLAELFPSLTKNYDENGNAILGLSGNVDTVTESIQRLVEQQNNLAKADIRKHLEEYVNGTDDSDGVFKALERSKKEVTDAENDLKSLENTYNSIIEKKGSRTFLDKDYDNYLNDIKDKLGQEAYDLLYNATEQNSDVYGTWYTIDFSKLELDETTKAKITESYNTFYQDLKTTLDTKQAELQNKNQEMSDTMMAWVEDLPIYKDSDNESFKNFIKSMVESIKWSDLDVEEGNLAEAKQFIQQMVLNPLSNICNDPNTRLEVMNSLNSLFTLDFSKMNYKEASEKIKGFVAIIRNAINKNLSEDEQKSDADIYEMFGLDDYESISDKMEKNLSDIAQPGSEDYKRLETYTASFTQKQAEAWLTATNGAKNADQAIQNYEKSLEASKDKSKKSFSKIWSELKESDRNALKKDVLEGVLDKESLSDFQELADNFSLEQIRNEILSLIPLDDKLSQFIGDSEKLSSAYAEMKKSENGTVSTKTLLGMPEGIRRLDGYTDFRNTVSNPKISKESKKGAFEDIITEYLRANQTIIDASDKTRNYVVNAMKDAGITNAEALVDGVISCNNMIKSITEEISNANETDVENFAKACKTKNFNNTELYNKIGSNTAFMLNQLKDKYADDVKNFGQALQAKLGAEKEYATAVLELENALNKKGSTGKINRTGTSNDAMSSFFGTSLGSISPDSAPEEYKRYIEAIEKSDKAKKAYKKWLKKLQEDMEKVTIGDIQYNPTTSSDSSGGKGKKNKSKETKTEIDWLSRRLTRMQSIIDLTASKLQNLFSVKAKKNNLNTQIKQTTKLMNQYGIAAEKYQKKANSIAKASTKKIKSGKNKGKKKKVKALPKSIIKKVQSGKITKADYSSLIKKYGQSYADRINSYIDYYDKAQDAKKNQQDQKAKARELEKDMLQVDVDDYNAKANLAEINSSNAIGYKNKNEYIKQQISYLNESYKKQKEIAELNGDKTEQARLQAEYEAKVVELQQQQIDNLKTEYENRIGLIGNGQQDIDNQLAKMEARGQIIQSSYYSDLNNYENQKISTLNEELAELRSQQNTFKEGTQEWYDLQSDIQSVENSINDAEKAIIENNKKAGELRQAMYDDIAARNSNISKEADFLAGLLGDNLTDDKTGNLTKEGLAALGTYGIDMSANARTAQSRKEQREEIENDIASYKNGNSNALDSYGSLEKAEEKLAEVIQQQQEAISAEYANEKQIYDLMTKRYETQLSYLKSIIDAKKQTLDLEKDLYDYQKNIANQTKNIATLEKQLAALQGDDSEEGRARRAKLQLQLDEANQDLQDTEYERYISDQQNMLDNLYSQYEDLIKELEKNFEAVVNDGVNLICEKSGEISSALNEYSTKYGYNPSTDMSSILETLRLSNSDDNPVIKTLSKSITTGLSGLETKLEEYTNEIKKAYGSGSGSGNGGGGSGDGGNGDSGGSGGSGSLGGKTPEEYADEARKNVQIENLKAELKKFAGSGNGKALREVKSNETPDSFKSDLNKVLAKYGYVVKSGNGSGGMSYINMFSGNLGLGLTGGNFKEDGEIYQYFKRKYDLLGFHTGGIVRANGVPKDGDYVSVGVNPNETILTQKFTDILPNAVDVMDNYTKAMNLPDYPKAVPNNIGNFQSFGDIVINADLPNVKDYRSFREEMKEDILSQRFFIQCTNDALTKGRITDNIQRF